MKITKQRTNQNQQGFASIAVALIFIVVLALLTVGFAQLGRREQQTALNKQLSNQAYYAAETGVNDAVRGIRDGIYNPTSSYAISPNTSIVPNTCYPLPGVISTINNNSGVSYTCVMVNMHPQSLPIDLADGASKSFSFTPTGASGSTIDLKVQWTSASTPPHTSFPAPGSDKFPPYNQWKNTSGGAYPAVIQFSVTPLGSGTSLDRNSLITNTFTTYLYPTSNALGGTAAYSQAATSQGSITDAACDTTTFVCTATITGIPFTPTDTPTDSYLVHMRGIYDNSNVTINGQSSSTNFSFSNSYDEIDATGKARNVLKRIHVFVNPYGSSVTPGSALQAQNICKRQQTYPGTTDFIVPSGGSATGTDPCNLEN